MGGRREHDGTPGVRCDYDPTKDKRWTVEDTAELDHFTSDWNHLNVRGSEQAAEIAWPAVAALLEVP